MHHRRVRFERGVHAAGVRAGGAILHDMMAALEEPGLLAAEACRATGATTARAIDDRMTESARSRPVLLDPERAARFRRARELYQQHKLDEAAQLLEGLVGELPWFARGWFLLGFVEGHRGLFDRAARALERAAALAPGDAETHHLLGKAYTRCGRLREAVASYLETLRLAPDRALAHTELGLLYQTQGDLEQAVRHQRLATASGPRLGAAFNNLGVALRATRRIREAIDASRTAVQLEPGNGKFLLNLGLALKDGGAFDEAIGVMRKGVDLDPRSAELHAALGATLALAQRSAQAIESLSQAVALDPSNTAALGRLIREKAQACDWGDLDRLVASARNLLETAGSTLHPFVWLSLSDDPALQRRAADRWVGHVARTVGAAFPPREAKRRERIRLGYLSADFHDHATAYLLAEVIELHDRGAFEVVAYSAGPDDGGAMRRRLAHAFDRFVDISGESDAEAARRVRADEIDILVDLKGYTQAARSGVVALRPAPVLVNYLGYPGTLGEGFADYVIGDATVTPLEAAPHYAEKLVLLPGAYQPNDRQRSMDAPQPRPHYGLPESALVLCCFNQAYKLGAAILDVWCEALAAAPDAVLWLLESQPVAIANLRRELAARGLDPGRLIAARRMPVAKHLARVSCADLFLDTFPYGAHTTGSDALWAGVPLVTLAGKTFASRVAASLLRAVGLGELATWSLADYRALVLDLVANRDSLQALRARLAAGLKAAPLFDSRRYTTNLERAFRAMWERHLAALPPAHIDLSAGRARAGHDRGA
jgi:predicted O-linked N-acetylglucosamine transferase (SPINDLY family)